MTSRLWFGLTLVGVGALIVGLWVLSLLAPEGRCALRGSCRLPVSACRHCERLGVPG